MSQDPDRLISTGSSPGFFGGRVRRLAEACRRYLLLYPRNANNSYCNMSWALVFVRFLGVFGC
jgi:hypothetical protein